MFLATLPALVVATVILPPRPSASPAFERPRLLSSAVLPQLKDLSVTLERRIQPFNKREASLAAERRVQIRNRSSKWLPWVGAAVGGTLVGLDVADEEDLVFTGKLMWIGIGGAVGAGAGWLIARIAGR